MVKMQYAQIVSGSTFHHEGNAHCGMEKVKTPLMVQIQHTIISLRDTLYCGEILIKGGHIVKIRES